MASSPNRSEEITPSTTALVLSPYSIQLSSSGGKQFGLHYGTNTIGRCTPDLADPCFVSIDNENVALSRLHATITIAPNHDCWLRDLGSTNGTHLAIREGEGITLEPQCFYQLSGGAVITLGDLPVVFAGPDKLPPPAVKAQSSPSLNKQSGPDIPSLPSEQGGATRPQLSGYINGTSEPPKALLGTKTPKQGQAPPKNTGPYLDDESETSIPPPQTIPPKKPTKQPSFMDDEDDTPAKPSAPATVPKSKAAKTTQAPKRGRKDESEKEDEKAEDEAPTAKKKTRPEPAAKSAVVAQTKAAPTSVPAITSPTSAQGAPTLDEFRSRLPQYSWPTHQKLVVCLSGMDTTDRERVSNRILLLGGSIVEEVNDRTTLLVVKDSPAARTPKFLMALAKGVMIATGRLFTDQHCGGNMQRVLEFVPELSHNGTIVSAPDVVDVILYQQQMKVMGIAPSGALSNTIFTITDIPQKTRGTVGDVILGSGGKLVKTKRDEAKALSLGMRHIKLGADDVDKLYDAIVSGTASRYNGST